MFRIRKLYDELPTYKQRLVRNKWKNDFKKSEPSFYSRLDSPTVDDLRYFSVVFKCKIDDLVTDSEVTKKARPLDDLLRDSNEQQLADELGLSK